MEKLNLAIIGAGRIGQLHANNILQMNTANLVAVSDVYLDHIKGSTIEKAVNYVTTDYTEILEDKEVDAILICTSTDTHVQIIVEAASAGKHVFCEKPISFSIEETKKALQAVSEAGVKLQIGFNRRFDKHFRKVYETVDAGVIGDPHLLKVTSRDPEPPPRSYIERSGGLFIDMTIHDFDMMRYLSGTNVKEVFVKGANLVDPEIGECGDIDTAIITLTFEDGSLGVIDNSRKADYGYDQRVEVFGSQGAASANNERLTNVEVSTNQSVVIEKPKHFFLDRYHDAFVEELHSFVDAIITDKPVRCSGEDGFKAELLAHAANLSLRENRSVKISEIEDKLFKTI
ncbi:inositol 2-dehydrogenase [Bacillus shivajii]|uniref:inositol 2-dehydrogenase n=1 Tax=Bacillus shivajii TaxID=1983719 RepID=UPI001CFADFDA|nr:inositol 2-dehydrogenase [Bacillus shivajii]UCZ52814.1 inositol 2-dehydrogenase [Bacillus shivajii]